MGNRNNVGHPRCEATYPPACANLSRLSSVRCKKKAQPGKKFCRECDPKRADEHYVALMKARSNRAVRPSKKERRKLEKERRKLEKRRAALSA